VRITYLLDGEAAMVLAGAQYMSTRDIASDGQQRGGDDLLDHVGGVVTVFFYENSVVGGKVSNTPLWCADSMSRGAR
jgi:hypothetical protein